MALVCVNQLISSDQMGDVMESIMAMDLSSPGRIFLDAVALEGGPPQDVALGPVLLRSGLDGAREIVRIFTPDATAAFSRRDTKQPGFSSAACAASSLGFVPVVRACGGRLAAYHDGTVVIDHIVRENNSHAGMHQRFEHFATLHAGVLTGFGLDAGVGEVPGEYCPGTYSVNAEGRCKIVGSAQRITRHGWLFSSIIQVTGSDRTREVLEAAYREIGYVLDIATIGSIEDFVPGVTVADVTAALLQSYTAPADHIGTRLPMELLEQIETDAAQMTVGL